MPQVPQANGGDAVRVLDWLTGESPEVKEVVERLERVANRAVYAQAELSILKHEYKYVRESLRECQERICSDCCAKEHRMECLRATAALGLHEALNKDLPWGKR